MPRDEVGTGKKQMICFKRKEAGIDTVARGW